ncbi:cyclin-domain-containing protein [Phellopilus nigrolimitatus]|nr:cyclin-domain-containing protein [Phellopilus nigrolimitatus]
MLSVVSPALLVMSPHDVHDVRDPNVAHDPRDSWAQWRSASAAADLPTPPSSVPPRRSKPLLHHHLQAQAHDPHHHRYDHDHLTLPPITHLDRHWPCSSPSPLTPPDDEMHTEPLWRDSKPGPSRLHSPLTASASPFLASPSPSPIDEDDDEQYDPMDDAQDELEPAQQQAQQRTEWDATEWQNELQQQREADPYVYPEPGLEPETSHHLADWVTNSQKRSAHFIAEKTCEMVCYLWFSSSLGPSAAAASRHRRERERERRRAASAARSNANGNANSNSNSASSAGSPPFAARPLSNARTASLQFCASPEFVAFMQKLLETTQVSQSVIVLSLHYIFRLKERNDFTLGKPGSEFRVAVCALMLANKFVDDNTYTNKTWSDVSAIPLDELNKMEREFLLGVGFRLFVDEPTYDSWLNLLRGLVLAKEREHMRWRSRRHAGLILPCVSASSQQHAQEYAGRRENHMGPSKGYGYSAQESHHHEHPQQQQRARSTSPHRMRGYAYAPAYPFTFAVPSQSHLSTAGPASATTSQSAQTSPSDAYGGARPHSKRRAADAFSPTSATFAARQAKRPTGLALDIGAALASASSHVNANGNSGMLGRTSVSAHPYAESLRGFERMSLGSVTPVEPPQHQQQQQSEQYQHQQPERQEHTLAAPYRGADAARRALPSHLYFYALASSPMRPVSAASTATAAVSEASTVVPGPVEVKIEEADAEAAMGGEAFYPPGAERKARLRYSRAPAQAGNGYYGAYGYNGNHPAYGTYGQTAYSNGSYAQQTAERTYSTSTSAQLSSSSSGSSSSAYIEPASVRAAPTPLSALPSTHLPNPHQRVQSHHQQTQAQAHTQTGPYHLPPLALALSLAPPAPRIGHTQSARTSPLPSFADMYGAVAGPSMSASHCPPLMYTTAPPSESVDGVYAPHVQHTHHHIHTHHHAPAPAYKPYTPAPAQMHAYRQQLHAPPPHHHHQAVTATSLASALGEPQPAAFANAGPPGVAHFYSSGAGGAPYAYSPLRGSSAGSVAGGAGFSGGAMGAPQSLSAGGVPMESQSVGASPSAYIYARGRRL